MKVLQKAELENQICICCGSYIEITYKDLRKSICNDVYWVCPCCHKEQDIQKALRTQGPNEVRICKCGAYFSCNKFIRKDKCNKCEAEEKL